MGRSGGMRHGNDSNGFTLTELLIIMAILGILAAVVVFSLRDVSQQSAAESCRSSFKTVETAAEAYKSDVGTFPLSLVSLTKSAVGLTSSSVGPWLRDAPPEYSPGVTPSITGGMPYGFMIDSATSSIGVGTIRSNGAKADSGTPELDGDANCASA